jgi:hypothetical protein
VAVPESLQGLVADPFRPRPAKVEPRSDFTFWNSNEIQHLDLDSDASADAQGLAATLAHLVASPPLEHSWAPADLRACIENLERTVHAAEGFDTLLSVWERDLAFPVTHSDSWQKIMNSCVAEPFRKRVIGFRNPTEALLGLGPDKTLLADFNWALVDTALDNLQTCCVGFLPPRDPILLTINQLRETLWLAYKLFLLSVSDRQLSRPSCARLARSFVAADEAGNLAPEQLVHDNPRTPADRIMHVRVIRKPPRDNDPQDQERGVLGRNREEKHRAEVFDWYCRRAHQRYFGKQDRTVLAPVFTSDGAATGRSVPLQSVDDFALGIAPRKWNTRALNVMLSNRGAALVQLGKLEDVRFPSVVVNRDMFSFINGVLWIRTNVFTKHNERLDGPVPSSLAVNFYNQEFEAEKYDRVLRESRAKLAPELRVFAAYFISTPPVQKILDQQQLPDEVCFFVYVFLGRMLYQLNDFDRWELWLYLQGKAGTGKSSLLNIIMHTYTEKDIAIISNRTQRNFQTEHLRDALVYLCPDCSKDFGLDQTEWCKMVTGEKSNMALKHQVAVPFKYKAGGAGAGNEKLPYRNEGGNVSRRTVMVLFMHELGYTDVKLSEELVQFHPAILKKINTAYLDTVQKHKDEDPWNFLPEYFIKNRRVLERDTNTLVDFLCSRQLVELDPTKFTWVDVLEESYAAFCKARQLRSEVLDALKCSFIFNSLGVVWAIHATGRPALLGLSMREEPANPIVLADFRVEHKEYASDFSGLGQEVLQYNAKAPKRYQPWFSGLPKTCRLRGDALRIGREASLAEEFLREGSAVSRGMRLPDAAAVPASVPVPGPAVPPPVPPSIPSPPSSTSSSSSASASPADRRLTTQRLMDNMRRNQEQQERQSQNARQTRQRRRQETAERHEPERHEAAGSVPVSAAPVPVHVPVPVPVPVPAAVPDPAQSRFTSFGRMRLP